MYLHSKYFEAYWTYYWLEKKDFQAIEIRVSAICNIQGFIILDVQVFLSQLKVSTWYLKYGFSDLRNMKMKKNTIFTYFLFINIV